MLPNDLPEWYSVYDQGQRWLKTGCFEVLAHDLRMLLHLFAGKQEQRIAAILAGRTLQSTPESGAVPATMRYTRHKGQKVHIAVDTLGYFLAASFFLCTEKSWRVISVESRGKILSKTLKLRHIFLLAISHYVLLVNECSARLF